MTDTSNKQTLTNNALYCLIFVFVQQFELKQYKNACIVFVFACASVISEEVKERTEKLKVLHDARYEEHLNIWLISCLRGSNLNIDWQS